MTKFIIKIETHPDRYIERSFDAKDYEKALFKAYDYIIELQKINNIDPYICMYPSALEVFDTDKNKIVWNCYSGPCEEEEYNG